METTSLIVILFLITAFAVLVFAMRSKVQVDKLRDDPNSPDSSLSTNSPGGSAVENLDK